MIKRLIAMIIVLIIAYNNGNTGTTDSNANITSSTGIDTENDIPVATSTAAPTTTTTQTTTVEITFGDVIATEKWEVSIQSANFEPYEDGNVFYYLYLTVKNLQKSAEDPFSSWGYDDPVIDIELDYNDGYTYSGFARGGLYDSTYLDPLQTMSDIEYIVPCPQEVEDNIDAPLFLVISVEGELYKLIVR